MSFCTLFTISRENDCMFACLQFVEIIFISPLPLTPQKQNSLGTENCFFCSYLHVQEKGRSWIKAWAAVTKTEPLVLYLQTSGQVGHAPRSSVILARAICLLSVPLELGQGIWLSVVDPTQVHNEPSTSRPEAPRSFPRYKTPHRRRV